MLFNSQCGAPGIENWDVSNIIDVSLAFANCSLPATLNLSKWELTELDSLTAAFAFNPEYRGIGINSWAIDSIVLVQNINSDDEFGSYNDDEMITIVRQVFATGKNSGVSEMFTNTGVTFVPDWVPTDNATLWELIVREMFGITATGLFIFPDGTAIPPLVRSPTARPTAVPTASEFPLFSATTGEKKATTVSRLYLLLFLLIIPAIVAYVYSINSKTASRAPPRILGGPKNVVYHGLLET